MTNTPRILPIQNDTPLAQGNRALRAGDNASAITHYLNAMQAMPGLSKIIARNLSMAQYRYQASLSLSDNMSVNTAGEEATHKTADHQCNITDNIPQIHIDQLVVQKDLKLAVVVHAYYAEQLIELSHYLRNIEHTFDLYVTAPASIIDDLRSLIDNLFPTRKLRIVDNVGNDVAPFLDIVRELDKAGYDIVCKLHTKRDHEQYKDNWRLCLLEGVLGSKKIVNEIIQAFENDSSISLIGPALTFVSTGMTIYDAGDKLRSIVSLLASSVGKIKDWGFFAGTMYWAKVSMFRPLFDETLKTKLTFTESKSGELVGSAHLYERLFGLLPLIMGHKIALVDYSAKAGKCSAYIKVLTNNVPPRQSLPENLNIFSLIRRELWVKWSALRHFNLIDKKWYLLENPEIIDNNTDPLIHFLENEYRTPYLNAKHKKHQLHISYNEKGLLFEATDEKDKLLAWPITFAGDALEPQLNNVKQVNCEDGIKVSVVCLTYNHENYIRDALDGFVLQKANFRFEVIIGDDASTDGTADIINEYSNKYPHIFVPVLRDKNIGATKNLLDILARIRGKYVAINEGDDYWIDPYKLQIQSDYLDAYSECAVCFHPVKILNELSPKSNAIFPDNLIGEIFSLEDIARCNFIQTNSVMYRWNLHSELGDTYNLIAFPADHYLHTLQAKSGEIHLIPRVMAVYRKNSGGMFSSVTDHVKLLKQYGIAHIELFRTLDRHLDNQYTEIYLWKELEIHRVLIRSYLLDSNINALYDLCSRYYDVFIIAAKELGIHFAGNQIKHKNDLSKMLIEQFTISVVVTSYNHALFLNDCIDSVLMQKGFFKLEVIIADDGSTDISRAIAEDYEARYPDTIRLLPKAPNMGMLKNMKRAFDACTGSFIAICEGDDYWLSERKLHKQLCMLILNPDLSMCFNWLLLFYESSNSFEPHHGQGNITKDTLSFDDLIQAPLTANFSCCLYRSSTVRAIPQRYYTENHAADWLFNLSATNVGNVGFVKELLSVYRIHEKGQWSGLSESEMQSHIMQAGLQFSSYFPSKRLPAFFNITKHPVNGDILANSKHLLSDLNGMQIKYNALFIQGWIIDHKSRSNEGNDKYLAITDYKNKLLYWQLMESTQRPDVDLSLSPNDIGRYSWSGFMAVFSETVTFRGQYKLWVGQSCQERTPKWQFFRWINISDSGYIEVSVTDQE
jgi:glycosyltransferase involved in cell wall biosynthesis